MFDRSLMQRKADVRGIYPNQINEELAWFVGQCISKYVAKATGEAAPRIIVGRDGRVSSCDYASLVQGIAAAGGVPLPCGLATTDMVQWGVGETNDGAIAGVMITASHKPRRVQRHQVGTAEQGHRRPRYDQPSCHLASIFEAGSDSGAAAAPACAPYPAGPNLRLQERFTEAACSGRRTCPMHRQDRSRPGKRRRRAVCSAAQAGVGRARGHCRGARRRGAHSTVRSRHGPRTRSSRSGQAPAADRRRTGREVRSRL